MNNSQVHTDVSLVHTTMHLNEHFAKVTQAGLVGNRKSFLATLHSLRDYMDGVLVWVGLDDETPVPDKPAPTRNQVRKDYGFDTLPGPEGLEPIHGLGDKALPWKEMREDGNEVDPLTGGLIVKRTYTTREMPMWVDASGPDGFAFALLLSLTTKNIHRFQSLPELVQEAREQGLLAFRDDEDCEAYIRSGLTSLLRLGWVEQHLKAEGEDHYAISNLLREKAQAKLNERMRAGGR